MAKLSNRVVNLLKSGVGVADPSLNKTLQYVLELKEDNLKSKQAKAKEDEQNAGFTVVYEPGTRYIDKTTNDKYRFWDELSGETILKKDPTSWEEESRYYDEEFDRQLLEELVDQDRAIILKERSLRDGTYEY